MLGLGRGTGGYAAVQAAAPALSTLLLTPAGWLEDAAAGVSAPDGHELSCWQTGFWGALLRDLEASVPDGLDHNWVSCFGFRPSQAEAILQRWVAEESRLHWWSDVELLELERSADRIVSLTVARRTVPLRDETIRLMPRIVIDGSDLGDLMAAADAPFRFGWEPDTLWSEPMLQVRTFAADVLREQPIQSPTWVVMGQLAAGPGPEIPLVSPEPPSTPPSSCGWARYLRTPSRGLVMLNWPLQNTGIRVLIAASAGIVVNGRIWPRRCRPTAFAFYRPFVPAATDGFRRDMPSRAGIHVWR